MPSRTRMAVTAVTARSSKAQPHSVVAQVPLSTSSISSNSKSKASMAGPKCSSMTSSRRGRQSSRESHLMRLLRSWTGCMRCSPIRRLSPPEPLKPAASHACVMDGVLGVAMAQVVLDEAQIAALVGKVEAARVAQHMRMDGAEPRPLGCRADEVVHRLARERLAALGDEQPRQPIRPRGEIALDGAQLGPGDRLLDRQAVLQPLHPQPRLIEVDLIAAKADRFADAQPVAVDHENEHVVAHAVPPGPGRVQEGLDLARGQEVLCPLVHVRGRLGTAFYITPVGRGCARHRTSLAAHGAAELAFDKRHLSSKVRSHQAAARTSRSSRCSMSRSKAPYGLTWPHTSGVRPRLPADVMRAIHSGSDSTRCSISVFT